jgi:hypothetical protein
MGMWVTTQLAFGFDLGQGTPDFVIVDDEHDNDGDIANYWIEWCAKQVGVVQPWKNGEAQYKTPEWTQYSKAGNDFDESQPFEILTYHSYSHPYVRYFFALKESVQRGGSNEPLVVKTKEYTAEVFKDFCEKYNIPYSEPKWQIISMYG